VLDERLLGACQLVVFRWNVGHGAKPRRAARASTDLV
jgi:hypothetical protein